LFYTVPREYTGDLAGEVKPDLPWADEHHYERVGRAPLNPAPSYLRWPHHGGSSAETDDRAGPAIYFTPGELNMTISSLHAFLGDEEKLIAIAEGQA
jgi:hypothetical protein